MKPPGWRMPPMLAKEAWAKRGAQDTMVRMHDYEKHPVGAEASLDSKLLPTSAKFGESWKRRIPKGETERPEGHDIRLDVWRWPKGHPKGGKFAKAPKPNKKMGQKRKSRE